MARCIRLEDISEERLPDGSVFTKFTTEVMGVRNRLSLAEETGLNRESLYRTFNGKVQPKWDTVHRLLKAINVELAIAA